MEWSGMERIRSEQFLDFQGSNAPCFFFSGYQHEHEHEYESGTYLMLK